MLATCMMKTKNEAPKRKNLEATKMQQKKCEEKKKSVKINLCLFFAALAP